MDTKKIKTFSIYAGICAIALLCVIYFGYVIKLINLILSVVKPLVIGAVIAFAVNIIMKKIEKIYFPKSEKAFIQKTRRPVCVFLSFFILIGIIAAIIVLIVPSLKDAISIISSNAGNMYNRFMNWISSYKDRFPNVVNAITSVDIDWKSLSGQLADFLKNGLGAFFGSTFNLLSGVFGTIFNTFISVVFAIFLLASKDSFKTQAKRFVKYAIPKKSDFILHTLHVANVKFSAFIVGQVLEAIILGLLCAIGMLIFRFPYVAVISVLVGFTALIPVVGAYIGGIAGFLLICTISPIKALFFVLYLVILQQIEGNVIYPKTVGSSIGLPGIFVFVSVVVGGGIGGIGGMLLGVPLMATVYTLISEKIEKNAAKAKSKNDTEEPTPTISEETNETEL